MSSSSLASFVHRARSARGALLVAGMLSGASLLRCSADATSGPPLDGGEGGGGLSMPRPSGIINILGSTDPSGNPRTVLNALCGAGDCIPDGGGECDSEDGAGGAGGAASGEGGTLAGGGAPPSEFCGLVTADTCKDGCLARMCGPAGVAARGEVCSSANECGPGLGCVGEGAVGTCQPYCCYGTETSCESGDFCDVMPVVGQPSVAVPVCSPITKCSLAEPFPCPEGTTCQCSDERACMVVRADGRTSCSLPGTGLEGAACNGIDFGECAAGYVCASSRGCLKLCAISKQATDCPSPATCQAPAGFPDDLGVCVPNAPATDVAR